MSDKPRRSKPATERGSKSSGQGRPRQSGPAPAAAAAPVVAPQPTPAEAGPGSPSAPRPGWTVPDHTALPRPTYWPAVLALGITFLAWGIVTSYLISAAGFVLFVVALAGWIGELVHGH